jgi:hypothetical protein
MVHHIFPENDPEIAKLCPEMPRNGSDRHKANHLAPNSRQMGGELDRLIRIPHPPYWLDISPYDFWPFGFLKTRLKNTYGSGRGNFRRFCEKSAKPNSLLCLRNAQMIDRGN